MSRCALVAAVDFNADHFRSLDAKGSFDMVIAVDRGLRHLQAINREPDLIVGDFDSLGYLPQGEKVRSFSSHKDESDLELGLNYAQEAGCGETYVYGALSARLDHTIAVLQTCAYFSEAGMHLTCVGDSFAVRLLTGPASFTIAQGTQGIVSVFSANDCARGVSEEGLAYTVNDIDLKNRRSRGLSNELIGKKATISVREGTLYIFYPLA
ncbi:MAG: thiamine diphosphokinase [Eggerthellaceae bacterium]|jgi:thiamine pyrophosphokinase